MIVYSVKINIKKNVEKEWLSWMKEIHIKDVMNTNYFTDWQIFKIIFPESLQDESGYLIEYKTDSLTNYEAYVKNESKRLQDDHIKKFEGKFTTSRSVMEIVR
ncbi:MAG TPA: DUF4286 family protein [Ignavibacteriaceae bacterium]|nr:DUF4286 family protein [Ignavibacteriaceae bacterium]